MGTTPSTSPFALLGFPNYIASPMAAVSLFNLLATAPAGYEASYLQTQEPSDVARVSSIVPAYSAWSALINSAAVMTIHGLSLINSNISPNGYFRFTAPNQLSYNNMIPFSIVSSTNLTGIVTNIDENITGALDGLYVGPSNTALDWNVLLSFSTPSDNPATGTARAHFAVACQLFGTPLVTYPRLIAELWKSGSKVADLGWRAVTSASAASGIYIFPFDPTLLSSPTGAGTQIKLFGEYGGNGSYFRVDCVNLFFESSANGVSVNDSGWIVSPTGNFNSSDNSIPPQTNLQYFPSGSPWTLSGQVSISVLIMDDQVDHNPDIGVGVHGVPLTSVILAPYYATGYTQAGVFVAGTALSQQTGVIRPSNPAVGVVTQGLGGTTLGGQTYGADSWRRRTFPPMSMVVTRDEGFTILNSVMWLKGNSGAFYLSFDRTLSAKYQIFSGAWVTVRDTSTCVMQPLQPVQYATDGSMLHMLTFPQCDEKL